MKIGDLVRLKPSVYSTGDLIGIIVDMGRIRERTTGDGFIEQEYADVKWFNPKHMRLARFSSPQVSLELVSSGEKSS